MYSVSIKRSVEKFLKNQNKKDCRQIFNVIRRLEENPRPKGCEPLEGLKSPLYRVRAGNFRVIYQIEDKKLTVLVVAVGDRKDVYKIIRRLFK